MQALGSYKGGKMLFLGLGTGLGSTLIVDGIVEPMELGHLPYKKGTYEDYVGAARHWSGSARRSGGKHVADVVERLVAALEPDDVVLGGGNVKKLKELPPGCRAGDNANAFLGGFRMWKHATQAARSPQASRVRSAGRDVDKGASEHGVDRTVHSSARPGRPCRRTTRRCGACICASCSRRTPSAASA